MTEELKEYLRNNINTNTLAGLCTSINEIGPYVSGLSMDDPISMSHFRFYLSVAARRNSYRLFHIPKKSGGVRTITAPDGKLKEILRSKQEVTGLTVVDRPNVKRKFLKNLRVAIHKVHFTDHPAMHDINVIRGKLNFLRMVKGDSDSTYIKLLIKLNLATRGKTFAS